jgi:hypothetical protein
VTLPGLHLIAEGNASERTRCCCLPQSLFSGGGAVRGAGSGSERRERYCGSHIIFASLAFALPCTSMWRFQALRTIRSSIASSDNESGAAERLGLELLAGAPGAFGNCVTAPNRLHIRAPSFPWPASPLRLLFGGALAAVCRLLYTGRGASSCLAHEATGAHGTDEAL